MVGPFILENGIGNNDIHRIMVQAVPTGRDILVVQGREFSNQFPGMGIDLHIIAPEGIPGGEIKAINEDLADSPELVNSDPYGDAWMIKLEIADSAEVDDLMGADTYANLERE